MGDAGARNVDVDLVLLAVTQAGVCGLGGRLHVQVVHVNVPAGLEVLGVLLKEGLSHLARIRTRLAPDELEVLRLPAVDVIVGAPGVAGVQSRRRLSH